jgi:hypothetical protein
VRTLVLGAEDKAADADAGRVGREFGLESGDDSADDNEDESMECCVSLVLTALSI